ncbi:MAG: hypothetical protein ACKPHU_16700, partial [Planctomycetaceae bacterium]
AMAFVSDWQLPQEPDRGGFPHLPCPQVLAEVSNVISHRALSVFIESIDQSRRATFSLANQFVEHRLCRSFVDSQRNTNLNAVFILEPPPPFP